MRKINLIFIFVFSLFIFGSSFVLGVATPAFSGAANSAFSVNYQAQPDFQTYYTPSNIADYWPALNNQEGGCQARQDFVLQVAPGGCQPAVVRSDLLADQNVPVFCQIDALQLNPLINVKAINGIRFSGTYPKDVVGTGFHPARAALNTRDTLLGSPLINNIGYAVIILKQNPVEKSLPDSVDVTLSAQLEYDAGNALGIGRTEFLLKQVSDSDWTTEKSNSGFWNGQYFLRLESADANVANLAVYNGDVKIGTIRAEKGKTANTFYLPGQYCQAGLDAQYQGFESGAVKAKVEVTSDSGTDSFEVNDGSNFDNDRCTVSKITPDITAGSNFGKIALSCRGNPTVNLELRPISSDKAGSVDKLNDIPLQGNAEKEFNDAITSYEKVANDYPAERSTDTQGATVYGEVALNNALKLAQDPKVNADKKATQARILGELVSKYPNSESINRYKEQLASLVKLDDSNAITTLQVDGQFRTIRLTNVQQDKVPSANFRINSDPVFSLNSSEYSGSLVNKNAGKNPNVPQTKTNGKITSLTLERILSPEQVEVSVFCNEQNKQTGTFSFAVSKGKQILNIGAAAQELCVGSSERVSLDSISTTQVAKVILTPKVSGTQTETNISVKIAIEKRAIQLSPAKREDMIKNINASIKDWEKISSTLGKAVTTLKATCLATSAALIVKNLVQGFSGTSLAREQTMSGDQGWIKKCELLVGQGQFTSITQCLNQNEDAINKEIDLRKKVTDDTNAAVKSVESAPGITTKGDLFGQDTVDSQKASQEMLTKLKDKFGDNPQVKALTPSSDGRTAYSYTQLRDLYYNLELEQNGVNAGGTNSTKIFGDISANQKLIDEFTQSQNNNGLVAKAGLAPELSKLSVVPTKFYDLQAGKAGNVPISGLNTVDQSRTAAIVKVSENGQFKNYLFVGDKQNDGSLNLATANVYSYSEKDLQGTATPITDQTASSIVLSHKISSIQNQDSGKTYSTPINANFLKVRYYDTEPFKGLPSYVPFDPINGWYAKVSVNIGALNKPASYDKSAAPRRWEICNVDNDGLVGADDPCQVVEEGISTGVTVLGQSNSLSTSLIQRSRQALLDASSQSTLSKIKIGNQYLDRDTTASPIVDATQCQDFMSVSDCKILFNVCDPVICPTSRCDFGGTYRVNDVVQSGIVGSALLCLPNIKEPVVLPVCLTGIQAGVDGWLSIMKDHRDCLQNSLNTGQMTGICDEVYSVYKCEFFWRQVAPIANVAIPKLIGMAYGQSNSRGGGEYLKTQAAWDNAQKSVNYFTQTYATNAFQAFNVRSIEDVGTAFCRSSISASIPTSLKSLAEPESPPQFQAWFDTVKFSDVTVPATDQYKVFYHIYAGKTNGVTYQVYLKNPPASSYYYSAPTVQVASGFISAGQYASETKDFTAPEGYGELCVRINNEERCGFKQVSTSFAVNYLRDSYANNSISQKDITSEDSCISGSPSLGPLLANVNPQAALEEAALPQDYQRGIVRICASVNPGASTDPTRYTDVGYCGDQKLRCWLDTGSVDRAISSENIGLKNATLSALNAQQNTLLQGDGYLLSSDANVQLDNLQTQAKSVDRSKIGIFLQSASTLFEKLVLNHHKARLLLIEADANAKILTDDLSGLPVNAGSSGSGEAIDAAKNALTEPAPDIGGIKVTLQQTYNPTSSTKNFFVYNGQQTSLFYVQNGIIKDGRYPQSSDIDVIGNIKAVSGSAYQITLIKGNDDANLFISQVPGIDGAQINANSIIITLTK